MTAGELILVCVGVLGTIAFAALAVTLVRVRDTLHELRREVADVRAETEPLLVDLRRSVDTARDAAVTAQADVERFDRVLGSAEAISGAVERGSRVTRTALSVPMIKAAGLATGTSRAVKRLRKDA
jgi:hypothetical protein